MNRPLKGPVFGARANSEQRTLHSFQSPQAPSKKREANFAQSQERFLKEKKARDVINSYLKK